MLRVRPLGLGALGVGAPSEGWSGLAGEVLVDLTSQDKIPGQVRKPAMVVATGMESEPDGIRAAEQLGGSGI